MANFTIQRAASAHIPTAFGDFQLVLYTNNRDTKEHLALVMGEVAGKSNVLTRIHSECFTGDVLGSLRCDCGEQLRRAMQAIADAGAGIVVYMRQEGRGIGLRDKLYAYNLQDAGYDTVEANELLGHDADERDYTIAALILQQLGAQSVRLMTNNPSKINALRALGIRVTERVPLQPTVHPYNRDYLDTKARRMKHWLELPVLENAVTGNGHHGKRNGNGHR
jgi:3,4-dihydroxy 2-butanone 4-phosphate synthase/GTP cyclohydrolase II